MWKTTQALLGTVLLLACTVAGHAQQKTINLQQQPPPPRSSPQCKVGFMVAHLKDWSGPATAENISREMTKDQANWWREKGAKKYSEICFEGPDSPYGIDFLLTFVHLYSTYEGTAVVPQTTTTQVWGNINGGPILGTIYTTENKTVVRKYGMEFTAIQIHDGRGLSPDKWDQAPLVYDSASSKLGFFSWKTRRADDRKALEGAVNWIRDKVRTEEQEKASQRQEHIAIPAIENRESGVSRETAPANEMRSLVVTVDSVESFVHEQKCSEEYCDGYLVVAHDDSMFFGLICASHLYGETDFEKWYNASDGAKNCRPVRPERWAAKTDDKDFRFYSGPNMLVAEYQVTSERKR